MRHAPALIALALLFSPLCAHAQAPVPAPVGQIAMLPLPASGQDDVIALVKAHWTPYFETQRAEAFGRESLRFGRFDLDGDSRAELVVMVTKADWEAEQGFPFVVASWTDAGWQAIGWSWGDEDTLFATDDIRQGWRTVDTGTQFLYWDGKTYARSDKN